MTTYPLPTLAPTIDATGISTVAFGDIQNSLVASAQNIFGSDVYLGDDSQDGQLIGIFSQAIYDTGMAIEAVFNSFSPQFSQGAQLSSLVQINGLQRNSSSNSTAVGTVTGTVDATITNGVVADENGNLWNLPSPVIIPSGGSISVTVTAQIAGNISAATGTINQIVNPQFGWSSFVSTSAAAAGLDVETDTSLKTRQSNSQTLNAQTLTDSIIAAIANISGVTRNGGYDNDTNSTDSNGVPAGALAMVVQGGSPADIASIIAIKKAPGGKTYGTTSSIYEDSYGVPHTINYSVLNNVSVYFAFTIKRLNGFVPTTTSLVAETLANFINSLAIGEDVYATQCLGIASLAGNSATQSLAQTFSIEISTFFLGTTTSPNSNTDISIAFNAAAQCTVPNITITLV